MSIEIIKNHIKNNNFQNIYIFYGNEEYLKNFYLKQMQKKIIDGGEEFNLHIFKGEDIDVSLLNETLESYPVLSEKKLIIVKDIPNDQLYGYVKEYLVENKKDFPEYSVLVIYQEEETYNEKKEEIVLNSVYQKIATIVKFEKPKENDLVDWVSRHFKHHKKEIDNQNIRYMLSICDNGMTNLKNEIEKLCAYSVTTEITKKQIDEVITKTIDAKIFDLTDSIAKSDYSASYIILNDLFYLNFNENLIIATIYKSLTNLYRIKTGLMSGKQALTISKELSIHEFVVTKNIRLCEKLSDEFLRKSLKICEKADIDIRGFYGKSNKIIIERLIAEILNLEQSLNKCRITFN